MLANNIINKKAQNIKLRNNLWKKKNNKVNFINRILWLYL